MTNDNPFAENFPALLKAQNREDARTIQCPVAFISTRASHQRRSAACEAGVPSEWVQAYFPATDLTSLDAATEHEYEAFLNSEVFRTHYRRRITPPELGCALSHQRVYREIVERNLPMALVLEDDVVPVGDFCHRLAQITDGLARLEPLNRAFICHLGMPVHWQQKLIMRPVSTGVRKLFRRLPELNYLPTGQSIWWAHAYVVSQLAARRMLEAEQAIPFLADDWKARLVSKSIDAILASDKAVFQQKNTSTSLLQSAREAVSQSLGKAPKTKLTKIDKCVLSLKKKTFNQIPKII